jgi:ATP-dependent Lon protease
MTKKYTPPYRFGLLYVDPKGKISSVGCKLKIEHHKQFADGRMMVVSRGVERFKIRKVLQEKPVLLAEVVILEDEVIQC